MFEKVWMTAWAQFAKTFRELFGWRKVNPYLQSSNYQIKVLHVRFELQPIRINLA